MFTTVEAMAIFIPAGFAAALLLMGLFGLYDRRSEDTASMLKVITLTPPLILAGLGLIVSLFAASGIMLICLLAILSTGFCLRALSSRLSGCFLCRWIGTGLLISAALPFMLYGLLILSFFGPPEIQHDFYLINNSGREIVLREMRAERQRYSYKTYTLAARPGPSEMKREDWNRTFRWLLRNPKKLTLLIYDTALNMEIRWELKLTEIPQGCNCDFRIIYGPAGLGDTAVCEPRCG